MDARSWTDNYISRKIPEEPDMYGLLFRLLSEETDENSILVDLGCGGEGICLFLEPKVKSIIGVDIELDCIPYSMKLQADLDKGIPLEDNSADLVLCKFVIEHLKYPMITLSEVARILKPGRPLLLCTSNIRYYPYFLNYLLSKVLPDSLRRRLVSVVSGREGEDIYTTYYKCNTPKKLERMVKEAGLEIELLQTFTDYRCVSFSRIMGFLAVQYEILINRLGLQGMKGFIFLKAKKPGGRDDPNI